MKISAGNISGTRTNPVLAAYLNANKKLTVNRTIVAWKSKFAYTTYFQHGECFSMKSYISESLLTLGRFAAKCKKAKRIEVTDAARKAKSGFVKKNFSVRTSRDRFVLFLQYSRKCVLNLDLKYSYCRLRIRQTSRYSVSSVTYACINFACQS